MAIRREDVVGRLEQVWSAVEGWFTEEFKSGTELRDLVKVVECSAATVAVDGGDADDELDQPPWPGLPVTTVSLARPRPMLFMRRRAVVSRQHLDEHGRGRSDALRSVIEGAAAELARADRSLILGGLPRDDGFAGLLALAARLPSERQVGGIGSRVRAAAEVLDTERGNDGSPLVAVVRRLPSPWLRKAVGDVISEFIEVPTVENELVARAPVPEASLHVARPAALVLRELDGADNAVLEASLCETFVCTTSKPIVCLLS